MGFGNLGISEMLVIFVIVLVFFGPRRLPEIGRSLGSAMREFRRSLNQIQREFDEVNPKTVLRPDRSVLDRMPDAVRPKPPEPGPAGPPAQTREAAPAPSEAAPSPAPGTTATPASAAGQQEKPDAAESVRDADSGSG